MELGAFSISLAVKDIEASKVFYEKFGFKAIGGDASVRVEETSTFLNGLPPTMFGKRKMKS